MKTFFVFRERYVHDGTWFEVRFGDRHHSVTIGAHRDKAVAKKAADALSAKVQSEKARLVTQEEAS